MLLVELVKNSIDTFLIHLLIAPILTVFCGVLAAGYSKKSYIAPIVTLILSIVFDALFLNGIIFNSPTLKWHIAISTISYIIAIIAIKSIKFNNVSITKN